VTGGGGPLVAWARSTDRLGVGGEPPVPLFEPVVPLLDRRGWRALRADATGLVAATLFAILAMTPSVMPRNWLFQGMVSGISAAAGYAVGVAVGWLVRRSHPYRRVERWVHRSVPRRVRRGGWGALLVAAPLSVLVVLVAASDWQRDVRELVRLPAETSSGWLRAAPVIFLVAGLIVALFRGVRWLARALARMLRRRVRLPFRVAQGVSVIAMALLVAGLVQGVALRWALTAADTSFSLTNDIVPPGAAPPVQPERSGSPSSLSSWDTLGTHGQEFVDGGPSRARIAAAAGIAEGDVLVPIRVYAGLEAGDTAQRRAALAVEELERTGAFDRAVICVLPTTGTGWVDSAAPESLELMYGGDTAVVATQYSYLPSWLSFLFDRERVGVEGAALFDAVSARVEQLPEDDRPRLLVYGESLGTAGGEAAFDGLADIRERTDGVLWTGPLNSNELWSELIERRDPGTTEVAPVYADGLVVRFGNAPDDLLEPDTPWLEPRVAYLVHPSDPVVWWSWDLMFTRPDWLEEPRGEGVSPAMSWYPVVTFWQVSADLTNAVSPPMGYGHNYGAQLLDAWAIIAPPPGWTDADTDRAREVFLN
jgi:uncharacterized membrane protein